MLQQVGGTLQQVDGTLQQAKHDKASEEAFAASDMHQCKWDLQRGGINKTYGREARESKGSTQCQDSRESREARQYLEKLQNIY